jgi:FkbM family methyltransferase
MDILNLTQNWYIKINRYIFKRKFLKIFAGPLKGYKWNTSSNYDYITGRYEDGETQQEISEWFKPESVFYDLGANVGYYSFFANQFISSGVIYAFEPIPVNAAIFQSHLKLNSKKIKNQNIQLLPFAVSDKEQTVIFTNNSNLAEGNTYVKSSLHGTPSGTLEVKSYSIDSLVENGYRIPDIIKIDVEGAEYDVLLGAVKTLEQYKPKLLLATHDCHVPGIKDRCVQFLETRGYVLTHLDSSAKIISGLNDYLAVHVNQLT